MKEWVCSTTTWTVILCLLIPSFHLHRKQFVVTEGVQLLAPVQLDMSNRRSLLGQHGRVSQCRYLPKTYTENVPQKYAWAF